MPTRVLDFSTVRHVLDLLLSAVGTKLGHGWEIICRPERTTIDLLGPDGETIPLIDKADVRSGYYKQVFVHRLNAVAAGKRPDPVKGWDDIDDAS